MTDNSVSRSSHRKKVRQWCHKVLDEMAKLGEDEITGFATKALEKAGDDSARQTLVELSVGVGTAGVTASLVRSAIRHGTSRLARAAADLLIDIKDYDAARSIIEECLRSEDSAIRVRAVEAIEMHEGPEMFELLERALQSDDDAVSRAAVSSLGLIVANKYHPMKASLFDSLSKEDGTLFKLFSGEGNVDMKREFAQILGFADSDTVIPLLGELSYDADVQTRREAVLALAAIGSSEAMAVTEKKLDDEDEMVVTFALDSLASKIGRDSEHMLECIKKVMNHKNEAVRRNAVMMLNWFPPSQAESLLTEAADDPDFEVQRSAQSLLRTMKAEHAPIGLKDMEDSVWGEDTLKIWEAGNVGMESARSERKSTVDAGIIATEEIVMELEKQVLRGDSSRRSHAINELLELEDISESDLLKKALYDEGESIRARVARGLDFTRDAGLITGVLSDHPDDLVRRRAVEALTENPSGRKMLDPVRSGMVFSLERTVGMDLFSYFLSALNDPDEGVIQAACYGIWHYLDFKSPVPVRETVERLEVLEKNVHLSSLTRDNAGELIDDIHGAELNAPVINAIKAALGSLVDVEKAAVALRPQGDGGGFLLGDADTDVQSLLSELVSTLGIEEDEAGAIADSVLSKGSLDENGADLYSGAICSRLCLIFNAVAVGAEALTRLGESGAIATLKKWKHTIGEFSLDFLGSANVFSRYKKSVERSHQRALINLLTSECRLEGGNSSKDVLRDFFEAEDDWIRLAAAAATGDLSSPEEEASVMELLNKHEHDEAYDDVLGGASLMLIEEGSKDALDVLMSVVKRCDNTLFAEFVQGLISAAQEENVRGMLKAAVQSRSHDFLAEIVIQMALLAGGSSDDMPVVNDSDATGDKKCQYAISAFKAMQNNAESAESLKKTLRYGDPDERELAAEFLGLARVESAAGVFASVSDQVDSAWELRSLCAGLMIKKGHRQGIGWFNKNSGHGNVKDRGMLALNLGRAVSGILPLMLRCNEVNVGRFV